MMKIHSLSNLIHIQKEECSQVTSIRVSAELPLFFHNKPPSRFARFKEYISNIVSKSPSRYQEALAAFARLYNLQEFTIYLELLTAFSNQEFDIFNKSFARFNELHTVSLMVDGSVNSSKVRKRLKILGETLAQRPKLETIKIHYTPKLRWSSAAYQLWQDLWLMVSSLPNMQNLHFDFDNLEVLSVSKWKALGFYMPKCRQLKCIFLKSRDMQRLNLLQLEALCDALAQAQTVQNFHLLVNLGQSSRSQRLIIGTTLAKLPNLENLDVSSNNILSDMRSFKQWQELGSGLKHLTNLKKLSFAHNNLGGFSATHWKNLGNGWSHLHKLHELDLSSNNLGRMNLEQLLAFGQACESLKALTAINLNNNSFGGRRQDFWNAFLKALEKLQSLEILNLSMTEILDLTAKQWQQLGNTLAKLTKLRSLNLSDNSLGCMPQEEWQAFLWMLKQITNLQEINVDGNSLSIEQLTQITEVVVHKTQRIFAASRELRPANFENLYNGLRFNFKPDELINVEHPEYVAYAKQKIQGLIDKTCGSLVIDKNLSLDKVKKSLITLLSTKDICVLEKVCKPKLALF